MVSTGTSVTDQKERGSMVARFQRFCELVDGEERTHRFADVTF